MRPQKRQLLWLSLTLMLALFNPAYNANSQTNEYVGNESATLSSAESGSGLNDARRPLDFREKLVITANTTVGLVLHSIVSSRTAYVGQMVYCTTTYPIASGNRVAIPAKSYVRGHNTGVIAPKKFSRHREIAFRFDQIVIPDGTVSPVEAGLVGSAATSPERHVAEWSIVGSMSAVNVGESARIGSTTGGAAGVLKFVDLLLSRAGAIVLMPGTSLEINLVSPILYSDNEDHLHSGNGRQVA